MTIWYTSDLHLGHARIIELCNRPFANLDEMHETIIDNWNAVVEPGDLVFVLGDVALGKIDESLQLVTILNGRKALIPGNHDRCWSGHKKIRPIDRQRYEDVGFRIHSENVVDVNGFHLCHFPYEGDSHDTDRFANHRPKGNGWLVHGHVHEKWKVRDYQINVGVDVWNFTPVHEDDIRAIMGLSPSG